MVNFLGHLDFYLCIFVRPKTQDSEVSVDVKSEKEITEESSTETTLKGT